MNDGAERGHKVFLMFVSTHDKCSINISVVDEAASNKDMHNYTHTQSSKEKDKLTPLRKKRGMSLVGLINLNTSARAGDRESSLVFSTLQSADDKSLLLSVSVEKSL